MPIEAKVKIILVQISSMCSQTIKAKENKLGSNKTKSVKQFRRIRQTLSPKSRDRLKKVTRTRGKPNTIERSTKLTIIQP